MRIPDESTRIAAAYVTICILWGLTFNAIRIVVQTFGPITAVGIRLVLASTLMFAFCRIRKVQFPNRFGDYRSLLILSIVFEVIGGGLMFISEQTVKSGIAAVIVSTSPLLVALISMLMLRRVRLARAGWVGLVLGLGGVCLLFSSKISIPLAEGITGELAILGVSLSYAIGTVYQRQLSQRFHFLTLTLFEMLFAGPLLLVVGLLTEQTVHGPVTWQSIVAMAYLVIFGSCIGRVLFGYLLSQRPASQVITFTYINPIVSSLVGCLVLNEHFALPELCGTMIILSGVWIVHLTEKKSSGLCMPNKNPMKHSDIDNRQNPDIDGLRERITRS